MGSGERSEGGSMCPHHHACSRAHQVGALLLVASTFLLTRFSSSTEQWEVLELPMPFDPRNWLFPLIQQEIACWMYTSQRQMARMRMAYLRSVLSQDVGAFDTDLTTANIIAGATNHMSVIQDAIGEKMAHFLSNFSTFLVAVIVAFACCWEVGMLSLLVVPMLLVVGATYAKTMIGMSMTRISFVSEATTACQ